MPIITLEMEIKVEKYLKKCNISSTEPQSELPLFDDPFRNGVILCEVK